MEALEALASAKPSLAAKLIFLIGPMFPGLMSRLPEHGKVEKQDFAIAAERVAMEVLERQMATAAGGDRDQSIIGSVSEYILFVQAFVRSAD